MTPSAPPSCPPPVDPALLAAAFEAFSRSSDELQSAYQALQRETAELRRELHQARRRQAAADRRNAYLDARLGTLLEALPGALLLLDPAGIVREANAAAVELLGAPLQGETWPSVRERSFLTPETAGSAIEVQGGRRVTLSQRPLPDGAGQVLLLNDVTEARRLDDVLARHRRLASMGEMAATLAHQIRTPLAAALLYAGNARREDLPAAQRDGLLGKAVTCLQDLERLIADMLQFARGTGLAEQGFDASALLASVDDALRPLLGPGQHIGIDTAGAPSLITGNREALTGALVNLGTNALHAAGSSARITIALRAHALGTDILVSDNGPGIAPALREKIFEPFYTSRPDGTGLGLAVARSIARAHGGDVFVAESAPGLTTFVLRLPPGRTIRERSVHTHDDRSAAA